MLEGFVVCINICLLFNFQNLVTSAIFTPLKCGSYNNSLFAVCFGYDLRIFLRLEIF